MPAFKVLKPFAITIGAGDDAVTQHFPRPGVVVVLDDSAAALVPAGKIEAVDKVPAKAPAKQGPKPSPQD